METAEIARLERWWPKHIRVKPRSIVPPIRSRVRNLSRETLDWLLPWGRHDYPGKARGFAEYLGRSTVETGKAYVKGNRRLPAWACLALAGHIRARCRAGLALAAELEAEAQKAKPRRGGQGFTRVDPVTGLDGRPKTGRRKVKEL